MEYAERLIDGPDGRVIEVATLGSASGTTVFVHHGTPGSSALVRWLAPLATSGALHLVTMSRAGYGRSSRREGRNVAAVVDDVRTVLDALGLGSYVAVGWSGGGPHALACAALDAPRCSGAWSLAGVVPIDADIDWTEGMGPENLEEMALAQEGGPRYEAHIAEVGAQFATATADNIIEIFGGLLSDVDKAALADDGARGIFADAMRHGFADGWRGFFDDDRAFMTDWGFDPTSIDAPVSVWYGDADLMVPPTHGAWLAAALPTATSHHFPGDGHLSIITNRSDELLADLVAGSGGARP
jgi:pimeloyl-ACP methyl ester carboxylesterase